MSFPSLRLGLDLGGTKIAAVVLAADGRGLWEHRVATPRHDYDGTVARIAEIVAAAEAAVGARCSVGIGMPGAISPATGLVKNANSTWLNGRPLKVDLERALAREVRLANDANCLAVSEAADGAAAGAEIVFGVILGTGVDYSIFMQLALKRYDGDLKMAYRSVGRALLLCGGTAVAGFGSLGLSSNAGMASLGRTCAIGIAANMLIAIFLLPTWWHTIRMRKRQKMAENK